MASTVSPFDFTKAINTTKEDLFVTKGYTASDYSAFVINRNFSFFPDTVMIANEVNYRLTNAPAHSQFQFYLYLIDKGKRFSKWYKQEKNDAIEVICKEYNYNRQRASEVVDLFTPEQITEMRRRQNSFGGFKQNTNN